MNAKLLLALLVAVLLANTYASKHSRRSIDLNAAHGLIADSRLPKDVTPNGYDLEIWPFPENNTFKGQVQIKLSFQEATDIITLHLHPSLKVLSQEIVLTQDETKAKPGEKPETVVVKSTERAPKKPLYTIRLERKLARYTTGVITLKFAGLIATSNSEGLFKHTYTECQTNETRWFIATHLRPNYARMLFPCFDEPAFKVPFVVRVARLTNMTAMSNMPLNTTTPIPNHPNMVWDEFQQTPPMSTFTVGIIISDLVQVESNYTQNQSALPSISVWSRKDFSNELQDAKQKIQQIVKLMQDYWGVPFPLTKLDCVALPYYQAVKPADNWGLIFFKESDLSGKGVWKIAQEIAYQWVGDFATPFWWNEAHINKALASYLAAVTAFKIDNASEMQGKWPMTVLYSIYYEFSKRYPHSRITGMKQETTAVKTELVFRMLNYTIGEKTFRLGLQRFIMDRQFKTYFGDDIWNAMTTQGRLDKTIAPPLTVNDIADSWLSKERLPVLNVARNYKERSVRFAQTVYLRDRPHDAPDRDALLWYIPIVMVTQNNLDFTNTTPALWMKAQRDVEMKALPAGDYFIIVNPEEIGPFPVNYDETNWKMISGFLLNNDSRNSIPVNTRAKLLHDAWNLAYAGDLSFAIALDMTLFLKHERHHLAWDPVFTMIDHIGRHIDGSKVYKWFETYVRLMLTPLYEELGNEPVEGEEAGRTNLRSLANVFLCRTGYKPCIEEAQAAYEKWMISSDPDEGNPVANQYICPVFKWGTREEWEFGLDRVIHFPPSRKQNERTYLLKTLAGCPNEAWKIEKLLNLTILEENGNFTDNDVFLIFSMLTGSSNGYNTLFNFLSANWDTIKIRFESKPNLWDNLITSATSAFTTEEGLQKVTELYNKRRKQFGSAQHIVEKSMKNIKEETKWTKENLPVIEQWLKEYLQKNGNNLADA